MDSVPPVCVNADSCKPPVSPQPGVFGVPASATFSGPGNATPAVAPPPPAKTVTKKTVKCRKGFVKKLKKKDQCVKLKSKQQGEKVQPRQGEGITMKVAADFVAGLFCSLALAASASVVSAVRRFWRAELRSVGDGTGRRPNSKRSMNWVRRMCRRVRIRMR